MVGLFMVLPVLAPYVAEFPDATGLLVGLAVGVYGLTQAGLQIPFGRLSDRIGRRPVIVIGLALFAAGGLVAAFAESAWLLVLGRALQGAGAVSAATTAFVSDLTTSEQRTRAMAVIGMVIGAAFIVSFVAGPMLAGWFGVPGLFLISSLFALAGIGLLFIPEQVELRTEQDVPWIGLYRALAAELGGILLLHLVLTAVFVVLPFLMLERLSLDPTGQGLVYLLVLLASLPLLLGQIMLAEKVSEFVAQLLALGMLALGLGLMALGSGDWPLLVGAVLFFGGFNFMESLLPAQVSRRADGRFRGAAFGGYATCQFAGAFLGGLAGGLMFAVAGAAAVLLLLASLAVVWAVMFSLFGRRGSEPK